MSRPATDCIPLLQDTGEMGVRLRAKFVCNYLSVLPPSLPPSGRRTDVKDLRSVPGK